jgi:O-antigen/teichoic acid export membrane protein
VTGHRLATRVALNSAFQLAGVIGAALISLFTFAAITRSLGPGSYGHYSAALALVLIPMILSDLGLSTTVLRDISESPETTGRVVSASLTARVAIAMVAFPLTVALSWALPLPHETRIAAMFAAAGAFLLLINAGVLPVLQAELRLHWAMGANIAGRLLALALTLLVLSEGKGLYLVVLAYVAGNALTLGVNLAGVKRTVKLRPVLDIPYCWSIARRSLLLATAVIAGSLYFRIDMIILAALRPSTDVGLYSADYKFLDLSLLVVGAVAVTVFSHLTKVIASDRRALAADAQRIFNVLLALGCGISTIVLFHADHLVRLASGTQYDAAIPALRMLAPGILLCFFTALFERMLLAGHREGRLLAVSGAVFVFNITLNLLLIPMYGFKAAVLVTVASEALWVTLSIVVVRRSFGFTPRPNFVPQVAAATALAALALTVLPAPWPAQEVVAAVGYALALVVLPGPGWGYVVAVLPPNLTRQPRRWAGSFLR